MRQGELPIVAGTEGADPGVEELHGLNPRLDLSGQVIGDDRRQLFTESMPGGRLTVHQRFRARVPGRRTSLDRVRRQGERRAGEPDERHPAVELRAHLPDRVEHVGERVTRLEVPDLVHFRRRRDGRIDDGTLTLDEVERDAHRCQRQEEIGEENGGVDVDLLHRLQGDGGREVWRPAEVEQRIAMA